MSKQATEQATPVGVTVRRAPSGVAVALRVETPFVHWKAVAVERTFTGDEARALAEALYDAAREPCGVPDCPRGGDHQWRVGEKDYRLCAKHAKPFARLWRRVRDQQYDQDRRAEKRREKRFQAREVRWMREHKVRASVEGEE